MKNITLFSIFSLFLTFSGILLPMSQGIQINSPSPNNTHTTKTIPAALGPDFKAITKDQSPRIYECRKEAPFEHPQGLITEPMLDRLSRFEQIKNFLELSEKEPKSKEISEKTDVKYLDLSKAIQTISLTTKLSYHFVYNSIIFCAYHIMSVEIQDFKKQLDIIDQQITNINNALIKKIGEITIIEEKIQTLQATYPTELEKNQNAYKQRLNNLNSELEKANADKSDCEQKIANLREQQENITNNTKLVSKQLEQCGQLLDERINLITETNQLCRAIDFAKLFNYLNMESNTPHQDNLAATKSFISYTKQKCTTDEFEFTPELQQEILIIDANTIDKMEDNIAQNNLEELLKNHVKTQINKHAIKAQVDLESMTGRSLAWGSQQLIAGSDLNPENDKAYQKTLAVLNKLERRTLQKKLLESKTVEKQSTTSLYLRAVALEALTSTSTKIDSMKITKKIENLTTQITPLSNNKKAYSAIIKKASADGITALAFGALGAATYHKLFFYATGYNNAADRWTSHIATTIGAFITLTSSVFLGIFEPDDYYTRTKTSRLGTVAKFIGSPIFSTLKLTQFLWGTIQRHTLMSQANKNLQEITKATNTVINSDATTKLIEQINNPETIIICEQ